MIRCMLILLLFVFTLTSCKDQIIDVQKVEFAFEDGFEEADSVMIEEFASVSARDQVNLVFHTDATFKGSEFRDGDHINAFFKAPVPRGRGWRNPGYSVWINRDGEIYVLKDFNIDCMIEPFEITNGARGYNSISVHIAYSSSISRNNPLADTRTKKQIQAMANIVRIFRDACPDVNIQGHRDFPGVAKSCPNFEVSDFVEKIKNGTL